MCRDTPWQCSSACPGAVFVETSTAGSGGERRRRRRRRGAMERVIDAAAVSEASAAQQLDALSRSDNGAAFAKVVAWLAARDAEELSQAGAQNVIRAVTGCVSIVSVRSRLDAVESAVEAIEMSRPSATDMLPVITAMLSSLADEDLSAATEGSMDSTQYRSFIVERVLRAPWPTTRFLIKALEVLREIELSTSHVAAAIRKFTESVARYEDVADIPVIYHNLLLFGDSESRPLVMHAFVSSCQDLATTQPSRPVVQVLATCIHAFSYAVRQDHDLGTALLNVVKNRHVPLGPVALSLLLSITAIHKFMSSVTTFLTDYIFAAFRWQHSVDSSGFLKHARSMIYSKESNVPPGIGLFVDVDAVFSQVLDSAKAGCDLIVSSLVDLSFAILAHKPSKQIGGIVHAGALLWESDCVTPESMTNPYCSVMRLMIRTLLAVFNDHPFARGPIVGKLLALLVSGAGEDDERSGKRSVSDEYGEGGQVTPPGILLSRLVSGNPHTFLDFTAQIRNSFEYITMMDFRRSREIITCLMPLLRLRDDLSSALVVCLRKSIFSRSLERRVSAIDGFLSLLCGMSSEATDIFQNSQSSSSSCSSNDAKFFLEVHGLLQRALTQQAAVRSHCHVRLYSTFRMASSTLRMHIVDLLKSHLSRFIDPEQDASVPFQLDRCIQSGSVVEPISSLFGCLCQCVEACQESDADRRLYVEYSVFIGDVLGKLGTCRLEDFAFDTGRSAALASQSQSVAVDPNLRLSSRMWVDIIDSGVRFLIMTEGVTTSALTKVLALFKLLDALFPTASTREKSEGAAKKRKPVSGDSRKGAQPACQVMNFVLIGRVLAALHGSVELDEAAGASFVNAPDEAARSILRANPSFISYVLRGAITSISKGFLALRSSEERLTFVEDCCRLGTLMLRQAIDDLDSQLKASPVKSSSPAVISLSAFNELLSCTSKLGSNSFRRFVNSCAVQAILERDAVDGYDPVLGLVELLEMLFNQTIDANVRTLRFPDEAQIVLSMMKVCRPFLSDDHLVDRSKWFFELRTVPVTVPTLAADLAVYNWSLENYRGSYEFMRVLAQDSITVIGDVNDEVMPTASSELGIVSEITVPSLIDRIIGIIEADLTYAEWLLANIKLAKASPGRGLPSMLPARRRMVALDGVFSQLFKSFEVFKELAGIKNTNTATSTKILLLLIRSLKLAVACGKFMFAAKIEEPSKRFRKLVAFVAGNLAPTLYCMFKFMQDENARDGIKPKSLKARVAREKRVLPDVIYQLEEFEQTCIKYASFCKMPELTGDFKRSAIRDFRFNASKAAGEVRDSEKTKKKRKRRESDDRDEEGDPGDADDGADDDGEGPDPELGNVSENEE
ncbi:FANCI solenoid 4 domain-containing protein [Plasmodiophora brassicae]